MFFQNNYVVSITFMFLFYWLCCFFFYVFFKICLRRDPALQYPYIYQKRLPRSRLSTSYKSNALNMKAMHSIQAEHLIETAYIQYKNRIFDVCIKAMRSIYIYIYIYICFFVPYVLIQEVARRVSSQKDLFIPKRKMSPLPKIIFYII